MNAVGAQGHEPVTALIKGTKTDRTAKRMAEKCILAVVAYLNFDKSVDECSELRARDIVELIVVDAVELWIDKFEIPSIHGPFIVSASSHLDLDHGPPSPHLAPDAYIHRSGLLQKAWAHGTCRISSPWCRRPCVLPLAPPALPSRTIATPKVTARIPRDETFPPRAAYVVDVRWAPLVEDRARRMEDRGPKIASAGLRRQGQDRIVVCPSPCPP